MEEGLIAEIRNFTATGYRSDLFNTWTNLTPYNEHMGRTEVDDYTLVLMSLKLIRGKYFLIVFLKSAGSCFRMRWLQNLSRLLDPRQTKWKITAIFGYPGHSSLQTCHSLQRCDLPWTR